jgi:hypothetical protein
MSQNLKSFKSRELGYRKHDRTISNNKIDSEIELWGIPFLRARDGY